MPAAPSDASVEGAAVVVAGVLWSSFAGFVCGVSPPRDLVPDGPPGTVGGVFTMNAECGRPGVPVVGAAVPGGRVVLGGRVVEGGRVADGVGEAVSLGEVDGVCPGLEVVSLGSADGEPVDGAVAVEVAGDVAAIAGTAYAPETRTMPRDAVTAAEARRTGARMVMLSYCTRARGRGGPSGHT